jgi:hypothetical protein
MPDRPRAIDIADMAWGLSRGSQGVGTAPNVEATGCEDLASDGWRSVNVNGEEYVPQCAYAGCERTDTEEPTQLRNFDGTIREIWFCTHHTAALRRPVRRGSALVRT